MLAVGWHTVRMFLHILAATIWVGGQLTLAALVPALRAVGREAPRVVARRFNQMAWPAFGVLVATGIWNVSAEWDEVEGSYRNTLIVKLVIVFLSGVTAAAVYHSHPHREEEFDLPPTMREQAVLAMENLKRTLAAAGCSLRDLVSATRFLTDVDEQDDLNRVWAEYLDGHLPTTTTVEVSRLATHARCKIEISAIAVTDAR
jgi:enamine deaminase RidA (YjgF/YER057c/UK114 family)